MKSVSSTPGKVILFGEHFVVYGIKAILCSIDRRIYATSQFIDKKVIRVRSMLGESEIELDSLANLEKIYPKFMKPFFYSVAKALEENNSKKGVEMILESEVPSGVGLGSSSAACVAATASVNGLFGRLTKNEILKRALEAERTIFEQTSGADSSVSTFGGLMLYNGKNGFEQITSRNDLSFVIADSGKTHDTKEVVMGVKIFKEKNESLFSDLCQQENEIVNQAITALKEDNLSKLGSLMSKNQLLLKKIGTSTKEIDALVIEAEKTAYGAKITGAGGGGCIISLVDESNAKNTMATLRKLSNCFIAKIDYTGLRYE